LDAVILIAAFAMLSGRLRAQAATAATPSAAQAAAAAGAAADEEKPSTIEKYVVTGSNILQAADAVSIPVAVIDSQVIQDSGVNSDILDILRKVAPNIGGVGEEDAQLGINGTYGGSSAYIEGLPTLVLIDGRRVADDPAGGAGGGEFVDLNLIPPAAVDRIEVLQTGASAVYGSDAVGGVINIILKRNYNGWETGIHFGYSPNGGHYTERSAYLVGGYSDDRTSITVGLDYARHDALYLSDRPYSNPIYGTLSFPGVIDIFDAASGSDNYYQLAPGTNAPPGGGTSTIGQLIARGIYIPRTPTQLIDSFNVAPGETLINFLERTSAMVNFERKIFGDHLVVFSNAIVAQTFTWSQLNAQPITPYLENAYVDTNLYWGFTPPPQGTVFVPTSAPTNPFSTAFVDQAGDGQTGEVVFAHNRFLADPRLFRNDSTLIRVVAGLRGDINDNLHWEAAVDLNRYALDYTNPGLIDTNALDAALADGQVNPFAIEQAPGALTGVVGTAFLHMLSTLSSFDFKVDGTPFEMPAGNLGFALGASYLREGLAATPDANSLPNAEGSTQGWSEGVSFNDFSSWRVVGSAFAELSIPVASPRQGIAGAYAVNADVAVRFDDYGGNVGSTTDPQVDLSWEPFNDQLKFRASTGRSFIAPTLYSLYGPVTTGESGLITFNVYNGNGAQETEEFNETGGADPDLKPTLANEWTAGFVYTPKQARGLSVTVDYSDIRMFQIEGGVPAGTIVQSVESLGTASPYASFVHYESPNGPTVTGPGGISSHAPESIYINGTTVNLGALEVRCTEIKVDYFLQLGRAGKLNLESTWTCYNSYRLQLSPTEPLYEYTGTVSAESGTTNKWRTYTTLDWSRRGADAFVGVTCISSVTDIGQGDSDPSGFGKVGAFTAFDVGFSYSFKNLHLCRQLEGLTLAIGANNVLNRMPPTAPDVFTSTNADVGIYDGAIGRMFYVNGKYSF